MKFELDGSGIVHKVDDHGNVYEALDSQPEKLGWGWTYWHKSGEWLWWKGWWCPRGRDSGKKPHIKGTLGNIAQHWKDEY